jgi:purine-binding chemotaxis protein CheW
MMKNPLAASNKLMKNYLSELLTEEQEEVSSLAIPKAIEPVKEKENEKLNKLLEKASVLDEVDRLKLDVVTSIKSENKIIAEPKAIEKKEIIDIEQTSVIRTQKSQAEFKVSEDKGYRKGSFQAMFFNVAGLLIAVPLIELGGIHNVDKTNSLVGKPEWFRGVMLHREEKINVVDTALWVMPEKCDQALKDSLNYQYIIMLNNSHWGLMAEKLVDTVTLEQEDVKWIENSVKRPWLAGLVKERMCALLDVDALIHMLDEGADINHPTC